MMILVMSMLSLALSTALCVSLYYNYKFGKIIIQVEDALEESLDTLDERFASITEILQTPLFYDSPQVRKVMEDLKESRDSILYVANQIGKIEEFGVDEDVEVQESEI